MHEEYTHFFKQEMMYKKSSYLIHAFPIVMLLFWVARVLVKPMLLLVKTLILVTKLSIILRDLNELSIKRIKAEMPGN